MYDQYALLDQLCLTLYVVPLPVPLPAYLVARFIDAALLGASSYAKTSFPHTFGGGICMFPCGLIYLTERMLFGWFVCTPHPWRQRWECGNGGEQMGTPSSSMDPSSTLRGIEASLSNSSLVQSK